MSKKHLYSIIFILIVLPLSIYCFYWKNNQRSEINNITSTVEVNEGAVNTAPSNSDFISTFQSVSDSKQALSMIDELLTEDNELARHAIKELNDRCQFKDHFSSPIGDNESWALEKLISYCEGYDNNLYKDFIGDNSKFNSNNPNLSQLIFTESTDIDEISGAFISSLHNIYYPSSDILADASEVLFYYGSEFHVPLDLGQSENLNLFDVQQVQMAAVELFVCQQHGGCGPDNYSVLMNCLAITNCQEGWSLMDYYQNTMSPINFNETLNILNFINRFGSRGNP